MCIHSICFVILVMECEKIPLWLNIVPSTTSHSYLTIINYTCADDYTFVDDGGGSNLRNSTCSNMALWEPPLSQCKGKHQKIKYNIK